MTGSDTAMVRVWSGPRYASYEDILDDEPAEYEVEIVPTDQYHVPHDDHVVLADEIEHHGTYAFTVETEQPCELIVQTNDSYHSPKDGFTDGRPVEGGLGPYVPEGHERYGDEPFRCELWGRIRFRVEEVDLDA